MSLPKLSAPIHTIELPVTKQIIDFQPFLVKQEKSMLTSIDPKKKDEAVKIFKKLLQDCVITEDFDIASLNIVDFYYLVLYIRMKSSGEMIDGQLPCKECKKKTTFEINLEESIEIINKDVLYKTVKVNERVSLKLIPTNVNSLFIKKEVELVDLVAGSVDKVIIDTTIYKDFTQEELIENVFSTFTKINYDKISNGLEQLVRLIVKFDYICIHCGHKNNHKTDDITKL